MKIIFSLFLVVLLFSCKREISKNKKEYSDIFISLETRGKENPLGNTHSPFVLLDSLPKLFKGIPNKDSSYLVRFNTIKTGFLKKMEEKGLISQKDWEGYRTQIFGVSGIENGQQFFIIDLNNNNDFSDDKRQNFKKNIFENKNYKNQFPLSIVPIKRNEGEILFDDTLHMRVYPDPHYFSYEKESEREKEKHKLQLVAQISNFQYGTFNINKVDYKVALKKDLFGYTIIFEEKDVPFDTSLEFFSTYDLKDTLKLGESFFHIDSLVFHPSAALILEPLDIKEKVFGFRKGDVSKNFSITSLNNRDTTIDKLIGDKQYLLLDFWGTWCAPCKELTPDLVKLHQKHRNKINFASIAFQKDPKPALEYVTSNHMNWFHGWIEGVPKSGDDSSAIISGLRIECYPTFIVLDENLKIVFRTCGGGDKFSEMAHFLDTI